MARSSSTLETKSMARAMSVTPAGYKCMRKAHGSMSETDGRNGDGLRRCALISLAAAMLLFLVFNSKAAEPIPSSACLDCHADKTLYKTNAAGVGISLFVEESKM